MFWRLPVFSAVFLCDLRGRKSSTAEDAEDFVEGAENA
jgi:hypothetical protein